MESNKANNNANSNKAENNQSHPQNGEKEGGKDKKLEEAYFCFIKAKLFEEGREMGRSLEKAFYYYNESARLGNKEAYNELGSYFLRGDGVEKSTRKAFHFFQLSAHEGNAVGMYMLGKVSETKSRFF